MRLSDVRPEELSDEQRPFHAACQEMARSENFAGFDIVRPDGVFLGPWSVLLHFPEAGEGFARYVGAIEKMRGLSTAARQAVILTVGGHFNAAYEMYAHSAVAARSGLTAEQIATLCAGGRPTDLTREPTLAIEVTVALLKGGVVPAPTYEAVVATLGQDALDTIVFVTTHYSMICTLLNAYDVAPGSPTGWLTDATANARATVTT